MAVELMMGGYRSDGFSAKMEENAVQEAAAGLESVEKLIRLLSQGQQQQQQQQQSQQQQLGRSSGEMEMDCRAVADVAVSKFKKVISLLGRTRTGHARFRRAPLSSAPNQSEETQGGGSRVYCPVPIQQVPPVPIQNQHQAHSDPPVVFPRNGVIDRKDSTTTINFSYSSAISGANSFMSSLTGDTDCKQPSSSSAFQITNLSQVSSAGRPPLSSSSMKRKCNSSDNPGSGKCGGSSGRCHCSKRRCVVFFFLFILNDIL